MLRIKEVMKEKGVSQKHFCESLELSQAYVSDLMRNVKTPTLKTLTSIADFLNVDIRELFHSTKSDEQTPQDQINSIRKHLDSLEESLKQ